MSSNGPPRDGFSGAPPAAPAAVQQTTVVQMGGHKNVGLAVLLAFLFGPLGMLYATVAGAIVMFFVNIVVAVLTLGLGLFITFPLGILWAGLAASSHNKRLQVVSTQAVAGQPAYSAAPPATPPAEQLLPAVPRPEAATAVEQSDEEVTVVLKSAAPPGASCGSCGHEINPQAQFCSSCGAAQTVA